MKAYSLDLRQRIVEAADQSEQTQAQVAATFGVDLTFVKKLLRQRREHGTIAPLPHGGGRTAALDSAALAGLRAQVQEQPDASLAELQEHLKENQGVLVSQATVTRALQKLQLRRKKNAGGQ